MNKVSANLALYYSKKIFYAYFIIEFSIHIHAQFYRNLLLQKYILIYMINSYDVLYDVITV